MVWMLIGGVWFWSARRIGLCSYWCDVCLRREGGWSASNRRLGSGRFIKTNGRTYLCIHGGNTHVVGVVRNINDSTVIMYD